MGVWGDVPCPHTCTCSTHTHAELNMLIMLNMDASIRRPFAISIHVFMCCMCVCVHVCAWCMCGGHPPCHQMPLTPPTHLPPPQSRREPKTPKFNKSWVTNRDNLILFKDSLPHEHALHMNSYSTIADHPQYPPATLPHPPVPRKPKSEELQ